MDRFTRKVLAWRVRLCRKHWSMAWPTVLPRTGDRPPPAASSHSFFAIQGFAAAGRPKVWASEKMIFPAFLISARAVYATVPSCRFR